VGWPGWVGAASRGARTELLLSRHLSRPAPPAVELATLRRVAAGEAALAAAVWPTSVQYVGQMMSYGALVLVDVAALRAAWPLAVFLLFAGVDVAAIVTSAGSERRA
jgi:hypothetical protein